MPNSLIRLDDQPFPIAIEKNRGKDSYTVTYGKQVTPRLTWLEAAHEFGECIFHALECDGKIQRPTDH